MLHGSSNWRQPSRASWPDLKPATRRPCRSDEHSRRAPGEWRRLGARKASPRVGPPTKAGRARHAALCVACASASWPDLRPATRRPCHSDEAVGAPVANGAGSVPEKLRPGAGLPPKQAVRSALLLRAWHARISVADLDATTETHYLWERSRPRTTLGPPSIERPDPAQSFTPTSPGPYRDKPSADGWDQPLSQISSHLDATNKTSLWERS